MFLNSVNLPEAGQPESYAFLRHVYESGSDVVVPTLLLIEIGTGLARMRDDTLLGQRFSASIGQFQGLRLVPVDAILTQVAVDAGTQHRLRGADAVYVAVALRFGSVLVTRDREQYERARAAVPTRTPAEALQDAST